MPSKTSVFIPTVTLPIWDLLPTLYRADALNIIAGVETPEVDDLTNGQTDHGFYRLLGEDDGPGRVPGPDIVLLDGSDPGDVFLVPGFLKSADAVTRAPLILVILGVQPLSHFQLETLLRKQHTVAIRPVFRDTTLVNVEVLHAPTSSDDALANADRILREWGVPTTTVWLDVPGGVSLRAQSVLDLEAWSMMRTGVAEPAWINALSADLLGREEGLFSRLRQRNPLSVWEDISELAYASFGDARFRPTHDAFPDSVVPLWDRLTAPPEPAEIPPHHRKRPGRVLVAGSPHLVGQWIDALYAASNGKIHAVGWDLWDMGSVTEERLLELKQQGPFDLALEVLLGPPDERQQVLDLLLPHLAQDAQVWVHTLNLPATVTVQPVPETFTAVGFGGLAPFGEWRAIELSRPRNSSASDLGRAMGTAAALGFQPVEVDDSPGGVSARLFALWVNLAAWLLHDGLASTPAEVDTALKRAFGIELGPFALCDEIGLDVVEAVILGLGASFGLDRYTFCPSLTLRIEAGEIGKITDRGFYLP